MRVKRDDWILEYFFSENLYSPG